MSNTRDSLSIGYLTNLNFVKNTPLSVALSSLFSVFGYPDETLSHLVFHILPPKLSNENTNSEMVFILFCHELAWNISNNNII